MRATWQGICLWAVAWLLLGGVCHAQTAAPEDEYKKLIQIDQNIQPLGEHPFGENISLYDGTLSFEETDISVPGNGPTIRLGRSMTPGQQPGAGYQGNPQRPFGDWEMEIPRIETIVAAEVGWQTGFSGTSNGTTNRCTNFTPPPYAPSVGGGGMWDPGQWWSGYHLILSSQDNQILMPRGTGNPLSPTMSGMSFPIVTKKNWMISCGVTASDGGEGFLAIAPDGTRYTFAHLVYRPWETIGEPSGTVDPWDGSSQSGTQSMQSGPKPMVAGGDVLLRNDALMYVTQIQDRFGNTLTYHYDPTSGYLTSITASDGREVDIAYVSGSNLIHTVTVQASNAAPRTWTYSYGTGLTGVQLPDGSTWSFNGVSSLVQPLTMPPGGNCGLKELPNFVTGGSGAPASITHPSGLTATFTMTGTVRGRSYVPWECYGQSSPAPASHFPEYNYQLSVASEVVSGAGVPTQTWNYGYSPANESWSNDACATSGTCATTVYTDVTDPNGNDTRYTFSNRFDATEGLLQRTDYYSGAAGGTLMRSEANTYANPVGGPWPTAYGVDLQVRDNTTQTTEAALLQQRTTTQDNGDTYTWQALAFNAYTQPTDVKRFNSIAGQSSIEEATTYLNDPALWVLGLPQTVTNVGTGEVESSNTYNSLDELTARARFGQTLMNYTWNGAGQLASFTDGNNHTTSLSNYYRGIPQSISYPDSTSESLVVDDLGQISSVQDQAGNTTSYTYDPIGRIAGITYPTGDSVAWLPKTFAYAYVTSAERGIAANHWRRIITQGNAVTTTYFDSELRPLLSDTGITGTANSDITTATSYDWKGQKTFTSYPVAGAPDLSGITTGIHNTYDALERLTQTQQDSELGTLTATTAYLSGAGQQVTDPKGNVTTTYYQVFDEPSYDKVIQVQAPGGITQTISRDVYGNPLSITQSGLYGTESDSITKALVYDSYHRLCRTTEPESGSEVMAYDGANNLAWSASGLTITESGCGQDQVAAAAEIVRTYDSMNRVLTIAPPAGTQSTVYTYDALGNIASAVSGISTWSAVGRNKLGLLTGETLQLTGQNPWTISYAYDPYGHRSQVQYPGGEIVSEAPDALGRPTAAGSYVTGVGYYPNGDVASFLYGNGAAYVAQQNTRQLLSNFSYGPGSTLNVSEDFTYDADANITAVTDLTGGPRNKSFGYDSLNRLTQAQASGLWGTESYTYDALNNLRTRLTSGQTNTYNYDATNKLTSITNGAGTVDSFGYDNRGNETSKNGAVLVFDQKDQLSQIQGNDSYAYDAAGRRVSKTPNGGMPVYYFYNQAGQLMYQMDTGTAESTNFVYLGKKLVARNASLHLVAPGAISFSANPNNGGYSVSWNAVPGATLYNLQVSANGGSWTNAYSGSSPSLLVINASGGSYVYQVQACAGSTCTGWTSSATLGVTPVLPTITVPSGTIYGPYTVSWTAPLSATSYTVQESLNGGAWTTIASNTTATSISRPGNVSGSYTYQVSASNAYGNRGWASSSAVTINTANGIPAVPTGFTVPAASNNGSATLSWNAVTPAPTYVVQQSSNGGSSWTALYSGTGGSTAVSGLANGSYTYQLQACNTYGCSAWVRGGTLVVTYPPTTAPAVSVPGTSNNGSYTVSWSAVTGATSYTVQEQVNGGGWTTVQNSSATSWSASGHGNGTYGYQVQACNAGGCGPWSSTGTINVLLPPGSAPSLSVPASSTTGSYTVSWGSVATASSYNLQENANGAGWSTVQSGSATSWSTSGRGNGSYAYQVQACNASGCGPWSSAGTVAVTLIPATPTLTVNQTHTGSFIIASLTWTSEPNATTYVVQEESGVTITQMYSGSNTSWSGSYAYGPLRSFRVEACNSSGCSPWTNWQ